MVPALEILIVNGTAKKLILDGQDNKLLDLIKASRQELDGPKRSKELGERHRYQSKGKAAENGETNVKWSVVHQNKR